MRLKRIAAVAVIGALAMTSAACGKSDPSTPGAPVATATFAQDLGFHSVWVTDHVALPERVDSWYPYRSHGRWDYSSDTHWIDPLLSLQWAAAAAPLLKIGTSILVVPLRHPTYTPDVSGSFVDNIPAAIAAHSG